MNKVFAVSTLVLLATIGLSAYAYTTYLPSLSNSGQAGPGYGTLNIYLADPPPGSPTLKYLLLNVTSVTIKYSSNVTESALTTSTSSSSSSTSSTSSSTTTSKTTESQGGFVNRYTYNVSSSLGTNVNLTKLQGSSILLGSPKVPSGNVTGIILNISGARAHWTDGTSTQLKVVADGKLMVDVHFTIQSNGKSDLTINMSPGAVHISPGEASVLRPVLLVSVNSSGASGTTTTVAKVTETETTTS